MAQMLFITYVQVCIELHPLLCSFVSYPLGKKVLHVKKY